MTIWFASIAALGLAHIGDNPSILKALSPHYALLFMIGHPRVAFIALGAVVLCVTGAEALYADMGHFGKRPIRLAWFGIAMPALLLNYFGQGAMLLATPGKVGNPVLRDGAGVGALPADRARHVRRGDRVAGAHHRRVLGHQAGDPARLPAAHAHRAHVGARDRPDYVPFINWSLFCGVVAAVVLFGSSDNLGAAYGITVTIDMLITTTMTFFVVRYAWRYPWPLVHARHRLLLRRRLHVSLAPTSSRSSTAAGSRS